jgi:two-component system chemotaxis response regulator CheY
MRVLVVDDSRAMRAIIGGYLKQVGCQVAEACNGKEALDLLEREAGFGLALVDWNMPVMNGYDFIRAVRADSRHADLPLVMITTETEMSQVNRALEAGANEYIMKPFTREILLDKLHLLGILQGSP